MESFYVKAGACGELWESDGGVDVIAKQLLAGGEISRQKVFIAISSLFLKAGSRLTRACTVSLKSRVKAIFIPVFDSNGSTDATI